MPERSGSTPKDPMAEGGWAAEERGADSSGVGHRSTLAERLLELHKSALDIRTLIAETDHPSDIDDCPLCNAEDYIHDACASIADARRAIEGVPTDA